MVIVILYIPIIMYLPNNNIVNKLIYKIKTHYICYDIFQLE